MNQANVSRLLTLAKTGQPKGYAGSEMMQEDLAAVLKALTEEPPVVPQGEPVAWEYLSNGVTFITKCPPREMLVGSYAHSVPLYTTPPSSQLADAAVEAAIEATKEKAAKVCEEHYQTSMSPWLIEAAAAIRSMK